jgi:hypothetical protein
LEQRFSAAATVNVWITVEERPRPRKAFFTSAI